MIKLYLKKAFLDGWDNLLMLMITNVIYVLFAGLFFFLFSKGIDISNTFFCILAAVSVIALCFVSLGVAGMTYNWTLHEGYRFKGFIEAIKNKAGHGITFSLFMLLIALSVLFVIPSKFSEATIFGFMVAVILCWVVVILLVALQFYYPLAFYNGSDKPMQTFSKCVALLVGSPGFCLFVFLRTLFDLIISIPTCFIFPGFLGVSVSHMDAVRLQIVKFTWKRDHGIKLSRGDYETMLSEEEEFTGKRTLRELFFPWKREHDEHKNGINNSLQQ